MQVWLHFLNAGDSRVFMQEGDGGGGLQAFSGHRFVAGTWTVLGLYIGCGEPGV